MPRSNTAPEMSIARGGWETLPTLVKVYHIFRNLASSLAYLDQFGLVLLPTPENAK